MDWIGAAIKVEGARPTGCVIATIGREKIIQLQTVAIELQQGTRLRRQRVREVAGLCSWISSIVPALRPYTAMLWAAASAKCSRQEDSNWIMGARLSLALKWILAFTKSNLTPVQRRYPMTTVTLGPIVMFDASLTGGGAILKLPQGSEHVAVEYLTTWWDEYDHNSVGAAPGESRYQPLWEAYMLLLALVTWQNELLKVIGNLVVHGDALGVLQAVVKGKARNADINIIVAEIQHVLSFGQNDITAAHFWSEDNAECDALSRLHEGAEFPSGLAKCMTRPTIRRRPWALLSSEAKVPAKGR